MASENRETIAMTSENRETRFQIVHPNRIKSWRSQWRFQYKTSPRSNPSREGITKLELKNTLNNWVGDHSICPEGTFASIPINDSEHQEFWLKRCLTEKEKIEDWDIVILYVHVLNVKDKCWYKTYIKNKHNNLYSGRTITKLINMDNNYRFKINMIRQPSQNPIYMVEWTKLMAFEPFWVELKNILNS